MTARLIQLPPRLAHARHLPPPSIRRIRRSTREMELLLAALLFATVAAAIVGAVLMVWGR